LKKNHWILGLIVLAALAALFVWARHRIHFDFAVFRAQVAQADWKTIGIAVGCIYSNYIFRSARWAMLLRHIRKVPSLSLVGTQVMGFTAVALIGRVADPVRPYLVAKKTSLPLSNQLAVYIVERLFDAGSIGLIFSIAMIWIPASDVLRAMAHSGIVARLAVHHQGWALFVVRFGGLVLTLLGAFFLFSVRLAGGAVAIFFERVVGLVSKRLGHAIGSKVRAFHSGLDIIRSFSDFAVTASLSLSMWVFIALAYFEVCKSFSASPQLAAISAPKCVLLMVASGASSVLQLPVIGWFSQIGLVAVAIAAVLGAAPEAATACAAMLLLVTFLAIVPVGLIWAQFEHVSLRRVTAESEEAEEFGTANPAGVELGSEN
jgi:glycosyltransferase 2 family protein